jgi:hypothetical protein
LDQQPGLNFIDFAGTIVSGRRQCRLILAA